MNKQRIILLGLPLLLVVTLIVTAGTGAVGISPGSILSMIGNKLGFTDASGFTEQQSIVFWNIRLPRILASAGAGAILAVCGTAMQGLFRNPLADPSIIGVSAGATLAASVAIVYGGSWFLSMGYQGLSALTVFTFLGALITAQLVFRLSYVKNRADVATMLLAGIAINALAGAFTALITFVSTDAQIRSITFWTMGSMGGVGWNHSVILMIVATGCVLLLMRFGKAFNALALGETDAVYLGVRTEVLKTVVVIVASLAVGTTVAFAGMIGFVGLVVPHILRLLGGSDHRYLIPASAMAGSLLLCWADALSRTVAAPAEIPIGIITALTGAPVFMFLLVRQRLRIA